MTQDWRQFRDLGYTPENILRYYGIDTPPVPVEDMAIWIGAHLQYVVAQWDGALDARGEQPIIYVSASDAEVRRRFTVAHEIEANDFAVRLLMPNFLLQEARAFVGRDIPELARRFGVSQMVMEYRLGNLS